MPAVKVSRYERVQLDSLTGLRFIASAAIVYHHIAGHYGVPFLQYPFSQGVSVFFVLSGFILTYVYPSLPILDDVGKFYRARIAKIWPLHIVCFALTIALYIPIPAVITLSWLTSALSNVLLIQAWIPITSMALSFNAVSWTISVEAFFYLMFPLLIWGFARNWYWKLALSIGAVLMMAGVSSTFGLAHSPTSPTTPNIFHLMGVNPLSRLFEFVMGMTMCLAWKHLRHLMPINIMLATLIEVTAVAMLVYVAMAAGGFSMALLPYIGAPLAYWLAFSGGLAPFAGILILVLASGHGLVSWLLSTRPFLFLGEISFAIYMVHQMIFIAFLFHAGDLTAFSPPVALAIYLGTTLLASTLLYYGVERPARRFIVGRPPRGSRSAPVARDIPGDLAVAARR